MKNFLENLILVVSLVVLSFGLGLFTGFAPQYTGGVGWQGLVQFMSILAGTVLFLLYVIVATIAP